MYAKFSRIEVIVEPAGAVTVMVDGKLDRLLGLVAYLAAHDQITVRYSDDGAGYQTENFTVVVHTALDYQFSLAVEWVRSITQSLNRG